MGTGAARLAVMQTRGREDDADQQTVARGSARPVSDDVRHVAKRGRAVARAVFAVHERRPAARVAADRDRIL